MKLLTTYSPSSTPANEKLGDGECADGVIVVDCLDEEISVVNVDDVIVELTLAPAVAADITSDLQHPVNKQQITIRSSCDLIQASIFKIIPLIQSNHMYLAVLIDYYTDLS